MGIYLVQIICFQFLFFVTYWVFFRKNTFFQVHRFYLLVMPFLSAILPLIKIDLFQSVAADVLSTVLLPEIVVGAKAFGLDQGTPLIGEVSGYLWDLYYGGVIVSAVVFGHKIKRIISLLKFKSTKEQIINIPKSTEAFTFLNYIFIGADIHTLSRKHILAHERVHAKQKHTYDLLLFEVLRIVTWFNPMVYLYQKEIACVHEYIADEQALNQISKKDYYEKLLNTAFKTSNLSFVNTFFNHSSIKNRIIMLQRSKSKRTQLLKFITIIPIILGMLFYVSCSDNNLQNSESDLEEKIPELQLAIDDNENLTDDETAKLKVQSETLEEKNDELSEGIQIDKFQEDGETIPYSRVEKLPMFLGCEKMDSNGLGKTCMSDKINKHIAQNFDTSLGKTLGLVGKVRIYTFFKINVAGEVIDVKARAPHPSLEEEAIRIIKSLPKAVTPAMHQGKPVTIAYTQPIIFEVVE